MSVFTRFRRWLLNKKRWRYRLKHSFLFRLWRKTLRLLLYDLFDELERTRLLNEMIFAEMTKDSFIRTSGLAHEVAYWDRTLQKGAPQKAEKTQIANESLQYLLELKEHFPADQISILDVGSGPFTVIGSHYGDVRLNITAVDPLARYYEDLIKKYALDPPVKTIFAEAERLSALFAPESFVWVHARNSIDHASQPVEAIREMIALVEPGGMLTLMHRSNEGEKESYSGFHQWNLFQEGGVFYVCGRQRSAAVNVNEMVPNDWDVRAYDKGVFVVFEARRPL